MSRILEQQLPPGPRNIVATTRDFAKDPIALHKRIRDEYGDPFTLRTVGGTYVISGRADGIRAIFTQPAKHFEAYDLMRPLVGDDSLLITNGATHLKDRRMLTPFFHGRRIADYAEQVRTSARSILADFALSRPSDIIAPMQRFSFEVIAHSVCGLHSTSDVRKLESLLSQTVRSVWPPMILMKSLRRAPFGVGPWGRFLRLRAKLDAAIAAWIAARRLAPGNDVMSRMLEAKTESGQPVSDSAIRDQLVSFLIAGLESTAVTMSWQLAAITRNVEVYETLRAEMRALPDVPSWEELDAAPYLEAVVFETLRRFPVVVQTSRKLVAPMNLLGYRLAPGVGVACSVALAQLDEKRFPDPMRFDPQRHLGLKRDQSHWLPFGGGARRCIGASLAEFEMKQATFVLMREANWAVASDALPKIIRRSLTLGPDAPLLATRIS